MIVYPDTSFILSLWHTGDSNYTEALKLFSRLSGDTWLWCDLHQLEVPVAAQVATHREPEGLQEHIARTIVFRAERAVARGGFLRKALPPEAVNFALSLANAYGWGAKHTTLDLWHIGAAWELGANYFATFDGRQAEVARSVSFSTNL
ncbi:MAG: PIN domain-containing protein [Verrucomicrobiota bacterium]